MLNIPTSTLLLALLATREPFFGGKMKKLFILLGVTLPLLFFKLDSFALTNEAIYKNNGYDIVMRADSPFLVFTIGNDNRLCFGFGISKFYNSLTDGSQCVELKNNVNAGSEGSSYLLSGIYANQTVPQNFEILHFNTSALAFEYFQQSNIEINYDTNNAELVYPTGYFRENSNGGFSNVLVLDNKPDNARVLVDYRWHSIDDINIQTSFWSRKFDISYNTTVNSTRYNFKQWEDNFTDSVIDLNDTFENPFLVSFPIEDRTFHYLNKNGQESTLAAISANTVHQSVIAALNSPNSIYNSLDIFVAYAYRSGNNIYVSKWSQFYRDLQGNLNGVTSSDVGFIDSGQASQNSYHYVYDMTNDEKNNTSIINDYGNPNAQTVVNNIFDTSQFDTTQTIQNLNQSYQGVFQMVQNVPQMFSQLFSFMPGWVTTLLSVSIGLLVLVGLIKALL